MMNLSDAAREFNLSRNRIRYNIKHGHHILTQLICPLQPSSSQRRMISNSFVCFRIAHSDSSRWILMSTRCWRLYGATLWDSISWWTRTWYSRDMIFASCLGQSWRDWKLLPLWPFPSKKPYFSGEFLDLRDRGSWGSVHCKWSRYFEHHYEMSTEKVWTNSHAATHLPHQVRTSEANDGQPDEHPWTAEHFVGHPSPATAKKALWVSSFWAIHSQRNTLKDLPSTSSGIRHPPPPHVAPTVKRRTRRFLAVSSRRLDAVCGMLQMGVWNHCYLFELFRWLDNTQGCLVVSLFAYNRPFRAAEHFWALIVWPFNLSQNKKLTRKTRQTHISCQEAIFSRI